MRWLKNCLLVMFSIVIALIIAEFSLRLFFPYTPTFGSYFPRYLIDNRPSYVSGLVIENESLPFSMKPNYSHKMTDLAWHPKPFQITLDSYGYRNKSNYTDYDNVIVGDSVAYGTGVDDDQTVASILGEESKVYNLAISGAGPEMYMKMIDEFLKIKKTRNITILFYLGNDLRNLGSACWEELKDCKPPLNSKIRREDVSASPENPPLVLSHSILKNSFIAHFVFTTIKRLREPKYLKEVNLYDLHRIISETAIKDLKYFINRNEIIQSNKNMAIGTLKKLKTAKCVDNITCNLIDTIINDIEKGDVNDVFNKMKSISMGLINANCYPIGDEMENLTVSANYNAGYFYESIIALTNDYDGNIYNYISLLNMIAAKYAELDDQINIIKEPLIEKSNLVLVEITVEDLNQKLVYKEHESLCDIPMNCDKLDIFFKYLSSLKDNELDVAIYLIPTENQIKRFSKFPKKYNQISDKAKTWGINCVDLTQRFVEHYLNKENNALFLDGAHFTVEGNKRVAKWIKDTVNSN